MLQRRRDHQKKSWGDAAYGVVNLDHSEARSNPFDVLVERRGEKSLYDDLRVLRSARFFEFVCGVVNGVDKLRVLALAILSLQATLGLPELGCRHRFFRVR